MANDQEDETLAEAIRLERQAAALNDQAREIRRVWGEKVLASLRAAAAPAASVSAQSEGRGGP